MRALGIDVSRWKVVSDWGAVCDASTRFVGIKATEGNTVLDPTLKTAHNGFRSQPFSLGIYYHFARSGDPRKQAERFIDAVGQPRDHERFALDLEVMPTQDPTQAIGWVDQFMRVLVQEFPTRRPIIYTSKRIWKMMGDLEWQLASSVDLWAPPAYASLKTTTPAVG